MRDIGLTHPPPACARRLAAAIAITALLVGAVTACGEGPDPGLCDQLQAVTAPSDAPRLSVVVDNTASALRQGLSAAASALITEAQQDGAALDIVAVDGAGVRPRIVVGGVAMDPMPGNLSDQANRARALVPRCIDQWIDQPAADPLAAGSDLVAALAEAGRQRPRWLLVMSDGASTAGALDVNRLGFDAVPADVADAVESQLGSGISGSRVVWTQLGETVGPLPEPARDNLAAIWRAVLVKAGVPADGLVVDQAAGPARSGQERPRPADDVVVPAVVTTAATVVIPDALLFAPGSARLEPGADDALAPVARRLAAGATAQVVGNSADYGDENYQLSISTERARAVAARLVGLGAPASAVTSIGVGSSRPRVPEWRDGVHDERAAAANRRVEITLTGPS